MNAFKSLPKPVKQPKPPNRTISKARAAKRRKFEAVKRDVYALVDARDHFRARCCGAQIRLHRHHLVYRSRGGKHTTDNVALICLGHHSMIHDGLIEATGNANGTITFTYVDSGYGWESPCPT